MFAGTYNMRTLPCRKSRQSSPLGHTTYIRTGTIEIPQYSPPETSQLHQKQRTDRNNEGRHENWRAEDKMDESLGDRVTRTHHGTPGVKFIGTSCIINHMSRCGSYYWISHRSNGPQQLPAAKIRQPGGSILGFNPNGDGSQSKMVCYCLQCIHQFFWTHGLWLML
jgi:hypothetical protein